MICSTLTQNRTGKKIHATPKSDFKNPDIGNQGIT